MPQTVLQMSATKQTFKIVACQEKRVKTACDFSLFYKKNGP